MMCTQIWNHLGKGISSKSNSNNEASEFSENNLDAVEQLVSTTIQADMQSTDFISNTAISATTSTRTEPPGKIMTT